MRIKVHIDNEIALIDDLYSINAITTHGHNLSYIGHNGRIITYSVTNVSSEDTTYLTSKYGKCNNSTTP